MNEIKEVLKFYNEIGAEFVERKEPHGMVELKALNRQILSCQKCSLHRSKTNYVPGEGSSTPDIVFVGEAPGQTEDQFGRPFIGRAGQLLDRILAKMGYRRESVFIGNVLKCRPPNNREPMADEVSACLPYIKQQITLLNPRVIVCLGRVALNNLLQTNYSMGRVRGKRLEYQDIPLIPTYHPSYILHKRSTDEISKAKWQVWEDMQNVLSILGKR